MMRKAASRLSVALMMALTFSQGVLAQSTRSIICQNNPQARQCRSADVAGVIQNVINILLLVIGALAVIMLIVGGFRYVVSAGDSNALQGAKNTIIYALVGIVVAFMAWAAVDFVVGRL